jgi:hypothetical protein
MKSHYWLRAFPFLVASLGVLSRGSEGNSEGRIAPETKARPADKLVIVGTVPKNIAIDMATFWQTTVVNDECATLTPMGLYVPKQLNFPIRLVQRLDDRMTWITWRDLLSPGACKWQLSSIEYKADTSTGGLAALPKSSPWTRISFVCLRDCVPNSAQANDDPSEPVHQYCKFSLLRNTEAMINPCVFERNGRMWTGDGTPEKSQHILRANQHTVQFSLADLEAIDSGSIKPSLK